MVKWEPYQAALPFGHPETFDLPHQASVGSQGYPRWFVWLTIPALAASMVRARPLRRGRPCVSNRTAEIM